MSVHNKQQKIIAFFTVAHKKKKKETRVKQRRKHLMNVIMSKKCFKYSKINLSKIANKFRFTNDRIVNDFWINSKCFIISNDEVRGDRNCLIVILLIN